MTATEGLELEHKLIEALRANDALREALDRLPRLELPDSFLGAGCVAQTVWNLEHDRPPSAGIADYDLVYFDPDVSEAAEHAARDHARMVLGDLGVTLDIKNQARVHLWYRERFGYDIRPYASVRDAIDTWPTTATAVGVKNDAGQPEVYAPVRSRGPIRRRRSGESDSDHARDIRLEGPTVGSPLAESDHPPVGAGCRLGAVTATAGAGALTIPSRACSGPPDCRWCSLPGEPSAVFAFAQPWSTSNRSRPGISTAPSGGVQPTP